MERMSLRERMGRGVLVLDGAMGTQLFARGVEVGTCGESLNIESPAIVGEVHRAYVEAGSDAILSNTFGANRFSLGRHGLAERVREINQAAVRVARAAAGEQRYVLGDIGPSGDFLAPLGRLKPLELRDAFEEQAAALASEPVDGLIIETMTALDEVAIAIEAARSACGDLPVLASMSFDRAGDGFRTMMGVDIKAAVSKIGSLGVEAVGFNCGTATLDEYVELAQELAAAAGSVSSKLVVFAEPNAGKPELVDGKAVYRVRPEEFASAARRIHAAGISIIGGCCGTGPEHIAAVAQALHG